MPSPVLGTRDKNIEGNIVPYPQKADSLNVISNIICDKSGLTALHETAGQRNLGQPGVLQTTI